MTTEIHKNYMIVSSIDSMGQLMSCSIPEKKDIAAVVINTDAEFQINEDGKKYLENSGFLTILYSTDFSKFSVDFLMCFDIRLSDSDYFITQEIFKDINIDRYRLLCGRTDTYRLISNFRSKNAPDYKTKLVKKTEGIDSVKKYCETLFKDKSDFEINCILKCLTAARTGNIQTVFRQESVNFYEMIRQKVQDS